MVTTTDPKEPSDRLKEWDRGIDFDVALALYSTLCGYRTAWIREERQRPEPDADKIRRWEDERRQLHDARRALHPDDDVAVTRACDELSAQVRALRTSSA